MSRWNEYSVITRPPGGGTPAPIEALPVPQTRFVCPMTTDVAVDYAQWLSRIPWQLFCTLTFAHRVSDQHANKVFLEFVDRAERRFRSPITYVRGDERRFSGCGMPASPRHYHLLLASAVKLDREWLRNCWEYMAGERRFGAGGDFRIYDPALPGVEYVLKKIQTEAGDWTFSNLDYFFPSRRNGARFRRRLRRQLIRMQTQTFPSRDDGVSQPASAVSSGKTADSAFF